MLRNDIESSKSRMVSLDQQLEASLSQVRNKINGFSLSEWQSFTAFFIAKPVPKQFIEIMRAIMVVINYTPKLSKSEGG